VIFVDTSAWYARYTPRDPHHDSARTFHRSNREPLVTTDYVIDETLTLFKARGNYERAVFLGRRLFAGTLAHLIWVEPTDVEAAWKVFEQFRDKDWSFTDCVSYVVIQRLAVPKAFAYDEHFSQFGLVETVG
jgi:uncharacterized protein